MTVPFQPVLPSTESLAPVLKEIDRRKSLLVAAFSNTGKRSPDRLIARAQIALSSCAIENIVLPLPEVISLAKGDPIPGSNLEAAQEISNYLSALKFIEKYPGSTVDENLVLQLHRILGHKGLSRGPIGQYRDYDVVVGSHRPPGHQAVPQLMAALIEWRKSPALELHEVVRSAILHARFEFIHPFGDGNGRVGRLLSQFELFKSGIDPYLVLPVDEVNFQRRTAYYTALSKTDSEDTDFAHWTLFYAIAVMDSFAGLKHLSLS